MADDATVIVEVMSDSTEAIDPREKLAAYTRLPSLQAYLLVSQNEQSVEVHQRDPIGGWRALRYQAAEAIEHAALGEPLPLAALYAGTDLA